jgi:hypothetical protein
MRENAGEILGCRWPVIPYTMTFEAASQRVYRNLEATKADRFWLRDNFLATSSGFLALAAVYIATPLTAFIWWMVQGLETFSDTVNDGLRPAMWFAGTWLVLGPVLSVLWEHESRRVMTSLSEDERLHSLDLSEVRRAVSESRRLFIPTVCAFLGLTLIGLAVSWPSFNELFGLTESVRLVTPLAILTVASLGLSFGIGVWGVIRCTLIAITFRRVAFPWHPFTPQQIGSVEALGRFGFVTGLAFSFGAVFVPATVNIYPTLGGVARTIATFILIVLFAGGSIAFALPTLLVASSSSRMRDAAVCDLAQRLDRELGIPDRPEIAALQASLKGLDYPERWHPPEDLESDVSQLLDLLNQVSAQTSLPRSHLTVARLVATLAIPSTVLIIERAVAAIS